MGLLDPPTVGGSGLGRRNLTGPADTSNQTAWRTEIGWPIFETGMPCDAAND